MKKELIFTLTAFLFLVGGVFVSGVIIDGDERPISEPETDTDFLQRDFISSEDVAFSGLEERVLSEERGLTDERDLRDSLDHFLDVSTELNYSGYIIQFEEPSITERRVELEDRARRNEDFFFNEVPGVNVVYRAIVTMPDDVPQRVESYSSDLERSNERVKDRIADTLEEEIFVRITGSVVEDSSTSEGIELMGEFKTVFNGIALNISDEEAKEVEDVRGVKKVSRNMQVEVLLDDSVPLIQEGIPSGQLDRNGNNCEETGEECLTGEGIKIAIIDTGVDYTHPDLGGGETDEKRDFEKITEGSLRLYFNFPMAYDIGQQISLDSGRIAYYSNNKIYIYDFESGVSEEISLPEYLRPLRLELKEETLIYVAENTSTFSQISLFLYNLTTDENTEVNNFIFQRDDDDIYEGGIGSIGMGEEWVVYRQADPEIIDGERWLISNIYAYNINTEDKIRITNGSLDNLMISSPVISEDLVAYATFSIEGSCYDSVEVYNLNTHEKRNIEAPFLGGVVDFKDNKVLYHSCDEEAPQDTVVYYLYDLDTENYERISLPDIQQSITQEDQLEIQKRFYSVYSWIYKAKIGSDIVYFNSDSEGHEISAYDQINERYATINPITFSGDFDVEGKMVCFLSNDKKVYCHDYNSSYNYPIPEVQFNEKVVGGYDFINNNNNPMDDHGHGTHVAATAAGDGVLKGVAPGAQILAYKVLNSGGSGTWGGVIAGIEKAVEDDADILSLSLGGGGNPDDPISQSVDNAVLDGKVVVVAAGNSGSWGKYTIGSPGTARKAITVGATDKQDELASFSSRGPVMWFDEEGDIKYMIKPDIVAPGVEICAAQWNGWLDDLHCLDEEHITISGTSMAAPHVSGAVALLLQKNPDWTPDEVKSALKGTAIDLGYSVIEQGAGKIDIPESIKTNAPLITEIKTGGVVQGVIDIEGTVSGEDFQNYTLYYSSDLQNFFELTSSSILPGDGVLFEDFDTTFLPDGNDFFDPVAEPTTYLKLVATNNYGETSESHSLIHINNIELKAPGIPSKYAEFIWFFSDLFIHYDYFGIFYPTAEDALENTYVKKDSLEIFGNVYDGAGIINYEIEYSDDGENWYTEGISLTGNRGENVKLADWTNLDALSQGTYLIRLKVSHPDRDNTVEESKLVIAPRDLHQDWPKDGLGTLTNIADLNNNNSDDLIFSYPFFITSLLEEGIRESGVNLTALDFDGAELDGWPQEIGSQSKFSIADLTNDGDKEIVVAYRGVSWEDARISVFNSEGIVRDGWPIDLKENTIRHVVTSDLNNDGNKEIVVFASGGRSCTSDPFWCGQDSNIYVFDLEGNVLSGWPKTIPRSSVWSPPAIGDLNNDGNKEIVVFAEGEKDEWVEVQGISDYVLNTSALYIFNMDGSEFGVWPKQLSEFDPSFEITEENRWWGFFSSGPVLADLDGDFDLEIIFAIDDKIYAFNPDGSFVPGWPRQSEDAWILGGSLIAVGNVDRSRPGPEIVVGSAKRRMDIDSTFEDFANGTKLFVFHSDGTYVENWPKMVCSSNGNRAVNYPSIPSPLIADLDGDGKNEIISSCVYPRHYIDNRVYAFKADGEDVNGWPKELAISATHTADNKFPVLGDINGDGNLDFGFSSRVEFFIMYSLSPFWVEEHLHGLTYLFDLGVPYDESSIEWEVYGDNQNTNCYDCDRSLSIIRNLDDEDLTVNVMMNIEKSIPERNAWESYIEVIDETYNIPSKGYLDLVELFEEENVTIEDKGDYRLKARVFDDVAGTKGDVLAIETAEFSVAE